MDSLSRISYIEQKAHDMRRNCIEMGKAAGGHGAHFGPALSCIEAVACLYFGIMRHNPQNPFWEERDRFVLSKGHACLAYYAALAEAGYFPREAMLAFKGEGSFLSGHPGFYLEHGIELATGSLGNGFAVACGMAMAAKVKRANHKVYCIAGDGECNEGVIWEAAMSAAKFGLNNLVVLIDRNGFQLSGHTKDVMDLDLESMWKAVGWNVQIAEDGNDVAGLLEALEHAAADSAGIPHIIIANTVKGKGISFMERNLDWHAAPLDEAHYTLAIAELNSEKRV